MTSTLLTNLDDILHMTSISGSIDEYKINPHIASAQVLYIEPILGSDLYEKIIDLVETGAISGETKYKLLLDDYIIPSLVFHAVELYIPFNSYIISDGGTFQFQPSNANPNPQSEIDRLSNRYRIIGSKYDDKLVKYLCKNSTLFPEYTNNTGLVDKTETTNRGCSWYLGLNNTGSKIRT